MQDLSNEQSEPLNRSLLCISKFVIFNLLIFHYQASCPPSDGFIDELKKISWSPVRGSDIPWNFEKFLINHRGDPVGRYSAPAEPKIGGEIHFHIRSLIDQCKADSNGKQEKEKDGYIKEEWKYDYL